MKFRIFLTIFLIVSLYIILGLLNFYNAPLVGAANAQQANDTIEGFTISNFISGEYFYSIIQSIFWGIILGLWVPFIFCNKSKENN